MRSRRSARLGTRWRCSLSAAVLASAERFDCSDPDHVLSAFRDAGTTAGCAVEEPGSQATDKYFEKLCTPECESALKKRADDLLKNPSCSDVQIRRRVRMFGSYCSRDTSSSSRFCFAAERKTELQDAANAIASASPAAGGSIRASCSHGCFGKSMSLFMLYEHNASSEFPLHLKYFCMPNPAAEESGAFATCWQDYLVLVEDKHLLKRLEETPKFICSSPCNKAAFADAVRLRGGDMSYALALHEFACLQNELGFYCHESMQGLKRSVNVVHHDGNMGPRPHCPSAVGHTSLLPALTTAVASCSDLCAPWCQPEDDAFSSGFSCSGRGRCVDYTNCGPGGYGVAECSCTTFLGQLQEEHGCCLAGMVKLVHVLRDPKHRSLLDGGRGARHRVPAAMQAFGQCGIAVDPRCARGIGRATLSFEVTVLGGRSLLCHGPALAEVRPAGAIMLHNGADAGGRLQGDLEEVFSELLSVSPSDLEVEPCAGSPVRNEKDTTKIIVRGAESAVTIPSIVAAAKASQESTGELQLAAEEVLGAGTAVTKVSRMSESSERSRAGDYSGSLQAALARARSHRTGAMVVNDSGNNSSGTVTEAISWGLFATAGALAAVVAAVAAVAWAFWQWI